MAKPVAKKGDYAAALSVAARYLVKSDANSCRRLIVQLRASPASACADRLLAAELEGELRMACVGEGHWHYVDGAVVRELCHCDGTGGFW